MYILSSLMLYKKIFWFFISSFNGCKLSYLLGFSTATISTKFYFSRLISSAKKHMKSATPFTITGNKKA